jgi:hypothetical protein
VGRSSLNTVEYQRRMWSGSRWRNCTSPRLGTIRPSRSLVYSSRVREVEVAFCEAAAGESGQEVEFGSLVVLLLRGTPATTGDLSVDFGQPVLRLEAGQERVRRLVPTPVGAT